MYVDNDKLSYSPAHLFTLRERNNLSWNRNLYYIALKSLIYVIEQIFCIEINIYLPRIFFLITGLTILFLCELNVN